MSPHLEGARHNLQQLIKIHGYLQSCGRIAGVASAFKHTQCRPSSPPHPSTPHLDAAVLHNLSLAVDDVLGLPPQLLLDVALQVLDDAQAHLGLGAVGVHDGHLANLVQAGAQVQSAATAVQVSPKAMPMPSNTHWHAMLRQART